MENNPNANANTNACSNKSGDDERVILNVGGIKSNYDSSIQAEILEELDYFQIPIPTDPHPPASATINKFILTLQQIIHEMEANLISRVELNFPRPDTSRFSLNPNLEIIHEILAPFITVTGYNILDAFGEEIMKYLMKKTPGFFCSLANEIYPPKYLVVMQLPLSPSREIRNGTFLAELEEDEENNEED
ncbi:3711_t:CDS:2 [Ambispora leptoticha]|uniref:3711_t:CDS:1 n=1 Tax=Ambispora leptoticha TaxID=144679 RepID=A0A9N9CJ69_9GLOM|nr:3711_t:CDS:2 [Ambispora leptoticha]